MSIFKVSQPSVIYTFTGATPGGNFVPPLATWHARPGGVTIDTIPYNIPWPLGGTLFQLAVRCNTAQPADGNLVVTLVVNSVATALVTYVLAGSQAGTYTNTTDFIPINAQDIIRWTILNGSPTLNSAGVAAIVMLLSS
jgi:hypothetical protein